MDVVSAPLCEEFDRPVRTGVAPTHGGPSTLRRAARLAFVLVATRVGLALGISQLAASAFHARGRIPSTYVPVTTPVLDRFLHWDAGFYQPIIQHGYPAQAGKVDAFFPFYPLVARVFYESGLSFGWAAVVSSWVSLFFATWGVITLSREVWPHVQAHRAAIVLVWFPVSVFLVSGYAESTFIALATWSFWALLRDRVVLSCVLAALASATRLEGAILGLAIFVHLLARQRRLAAAGALVASELGLVAYSVYLWLRTRDPFAYVSAERYWNRHLIAPFYSLWWSLYHIVLSKPVAGAPLPEWNAVVVFLLDDLVIVAAVVASVLWLRCAWWRARPREAKRLVGLSTFGLLYLLATLVSAPNGTWPEAAARLLMADVPLLLVTNVLARRAWIVVAVCCIGLAVFFQSLFNLGYWLT